MHVSPRKIQSAPTSVVQSFDQHQWKQFPEVPQLEESLEAKKTTPQRHVHFSLTPPQVITKEVVTVTWMSRDDLKHSLVRARQDANSLRENNPEYLQDFFHLFQECSRASKGQELWAAQSIQNILRHAKSPLLNRGLETHKVLSKYRRYHVTSVLAFQKNKSGSEIRRSSMNTSRTSRSFARIVGQMDAIHVYHLLEQELGTS
jgi:hypothetical protein